MSNDQTSKYIALLGAYERDNFGDILFLLVTEKLLAPWPIVPLSLVSRDLSADGGRKVFSLSAWFDVCGDFLPHSLVVVGGQFLGMPLLEALYMGLDEQHADLYLGLSEEMKTQLSRFLCWRPGPISYLPHLESLAAGPGAPIGFAINSAGYTPHENAADLDYLADVTPYLQYFSARDAQSQAVISEKTGFTTHLHPDVVTLLPDLFQNEVDHAFAYLRQANLLPETGYAVFQASKGYVKRKGINEVAASLAKVIRKHDIALVLQPAGLAPYHDSLQVLVDLADLVRADPACKSKVYVQESRNIWHQVATIANSDCFIGTSLHGRIVAMTFARHRIGLDIPKVTEYAGTWERNLQPVDIPLDSLADAFAKARTIKPEKLTTLADELRESTRKGFLTLRNELGIGDYDHDPDLARQELKQIAQQALFHECEILRSHLVESVRDRWSAGQKNENMKNYFKWRTNQMLRRLILKKT